MKALALLLFLTTFMSARTLRAEDGYELWLRQRPLDQETVSKLAPHALNLVSTTSASASAALARQELARGLDKLLGRPLSETGRLAAGSILLATPAALPALAELDLPYASLGAEGFILRALSFQDQDIILVTANTDIALLYAVFELLRQFEQDARLATLDVVSIPAMELRLLNHWDNLDRSVERGYAGPSIWDWWRLPTYIDPRYTDYARANASIGINGTVLNNVNSNALILTAPWLQKVKAIADVLRPWGIRVYLAARFSAPGEIGGLATSDPLNAAVQAWWQAKADEIYQLIPDFGGFLVKANSEGQPGPGDFGRTHAEGANMLAAALAPHGGIVMWRAFVYSAENSEDRAKQAWSEFKPLDGLFADNVILQVKNGAIDFQPREPFHPLFGAMPATPLLLELQITKEYLGMATHLAWLGPLYEEVLQSDTHAAGPGSLVAQVVDGSLHGYTHSGMAGVANIGSERDWSGSDFNQANWYVFGRLAWNPLDSSARIAAEWLGQTFSRDPAFITSATGLMQQSREAVVNYMTPLGLAHLMGTGHHYGPAPWVADLARPEWNPAYYHQADAQGIGFERGASGSDALAQYTDRVAAQFADPATMDERYLLWFHHLPWQYRLHSGSTLWEALIQHYDQGVAQVAEMQARWDSLEQYVDSERFYKTRQFLRIQHEEAQWWRDACVAWFMSVAKLPLPPGSKAPAHSLEYYQSLSFPAAPG